MHALAARQGAAARRRTRRASRATARRPRSAVSARSTRTCAVGAGDTTYRPARAAGASRHGPAHAAVGVPRVAPAASGSSSSTCSTPCVRTFELHGFASIETRAVEPLDQLLRKGEIDKEVYVLRRLQADAADDTADSGLALHFDLTVPFARYVVENAGHLALPVPSLPDPEAAGAGSARRRAATASSRRPTSTWSGDDSLAFHHDVEVAAVMADALGRLAAAAAAAAGQQPQADRGLLPGRRGDRHPPP